MKKTINKIASLFLAFCFILAIMPELSPPAAAASSVWNGTTKDTTWYTEHTGDTEFTLTTAEQLAGLVYLIDADTTVTFVGKTITLGDDIMLNSAGSTANAWTPIGNSTHPFQGTFDGSGHTVSGVYINTTADYQGLFGYVGTGGTIENVGVIDSNITGKEFIGGVVGRFAGSEILNCYNTGAVSGISDAYQSVYGIGGVAGEVDSGAITGCHNTGTITASSTVTIQNVGGVFGSCDATVESCYNEGHVSARSVQGSAWVGGVAGQTSGSLTDCYNTGSIECDLMAGGVVGRNGGTMKGCYNSGTVAVNPDFVYLNNGSSDIGGVAGENLGTGTITECYNTGTVEGTFYSGTNQPTSGVGGVVGCNGATVINCFNQGVVRKGTKVGGVTGSNYGGKTIDCYNRGSIGQADDTTGATYATNDTVVGGVTGDNGLGIMSSCYSIGTVTGSTNVGGVIGGGPNSASCYWDSSVFTGNNGLGKGKTTAEMKSSDFVALLNQDTQTYTLRWVSDSTSKNDGYPVTDLYEYWTDYAASAFAGGTGTSADDPYLISNASELAYLSKTVNAGTDYTGKYVKLTADIDLIDLDNGGKVWTPIGLVNTFNGVFDGDNHSISNMYIDNGDYQGLFGRLGASGTIKNVSVINCYIRGKFYVGGIAGQSSGEITNCNITGTVTGTVVDGLHVGGIAGYNSSGTITNCYIDGTVTGAGQRVGGITGRNIGTITNCYTAGTVSGTNSVGGVVGYGDGGNITNCCNDAAVSGAGYVGGVVGKQEYGDTASISNCCNTGTVKATGSSIGGVAGYNKVKIDNCFNTGSVEGSHVVGGVVGYHEVFSEVMTNCFNTGSVTDVFDPTNPSVGIGGVVGYKYQGSICNCYNTGTVSGETNLGGVAGFNNVGSILNCYNAGEVIGNSNVGALIGRSYNKATFCYWDNTKNSGLSGIALAESSNGILDPTCSGYSTAYMKSNDFAALLNANKGIYNSWIAVANDYPTFGDGITYTVVFDKNGGNTEACPIIAATTYGGVVTLPTADPTRTHYTFTGWNTQADGKGTAFTASTAVTANLTVYAQWSLNTIGAIGNQTLTALTAGYASGTQETKSITITKAGTGDLTNLSAALSGTGMDSFTITPPTSTTLDSTTTSTTFTVKANDGLAAGTYTATMTVSADNMTAVTFTVTQVVSAAPSGGSGSDGSSGSGSASVTVTTGGGTTTAAQTFTAATGSDGVAAVSVTGSQITDMMKAASDKAQEQNTQTAIEIHVDSSSAATGVSVTIPQAAASSLTDGVNALTISSSVATVTLDSTALAEISKQTSGDITITATQADTSSLSDESKSAIGTRPVYDFKITSGNTTVSDFGGGTATVSVPYTPASGEDLNAIVVYCINASGTLVMVQNCVYNADTGTVTFTTTHFSIYAVGYNKVSFTDVSDTAWYSNNVAYLAARGIVGGNNGAFSPDTSITRAEFVTILARMSGDDLSSYAASSFTDVSTDSWYFSAVQWANKAGVSVGSDCKFDPNASITREQMAAMLYRYSEYKGTVSNTEGMSAREFSDFDSISSWARAPIQWAVNNGIISGNNDGSFAPKANATRAEAAKMIAVLLKIMIG